MGSIPTRRAEPLLAEGNLVEWQHERCGLVQGHVDEIEGGIVTVEISYVEHEGAGVHKRHDLIVLPLDSAERTMRVTTRLYTRHRAGGLTPEEADREQEAIRQRWQRYHQRRERRLLRAILGDGNG